MPLIPECSIIFFGETGTGKSSAINLLLETGTSAQVCNDSHPCTQNSTNYKTILNDTRYTLWDTRGLGEASGFLRNVFRLGVGREKEFKKFLKERHQRREIDLLVYCVRGSRATDALVKYYNKFCVITRQLAAPVVILVTHLERESNSMDDWWRSNSSRLAYLKMEFDDYACITTLPGHARTSESKRRLVDLITKKRCWQAHHNGSYFGSPVPASISSAPPRKGLIQGLFKQKFEGVASVGAPIHGSGTRPDFPNATASTYHTPEPPGNSIPSSPIVIPPTPSSATVESTNFSPTDVGRLAVDHPSPSSSEASSCAGVSLYSLVPSPHSSNTSHTEVPLQSCTEESDGYLMRELPFRHSAATVVRRKNYPVRDGGFGNIWECDLLQEGSSCMVAVKAVKLGNKDLKSYDKKLRRELKVWGSLQHQNIVPLLGIVYGFGPLPSMVSPWFRKGCLSCYLERRPRLKSQRCQLLGDIATGLSYLHSQGVTHGDLHSENVLIDDSGRAFLTDFGLSLISEFVGTSCLTSSFFGALQFADPALIQRVSHNPNDICYPTKPCDVYSFGGLILHVLSDKKPYDELHIIEVWQKVLTGERPNIPTHDERVTLYQLQIRMCWDPEEHRRPSADILAAIFARKL